MKILHALHGYPPEHKGGTERYVQRLAEVQRAAGNDVVIAAGSFSDRYDGFEETKGSRSGIRVFRISQKGLFAERWDHASSPFIDECFGSLLDAQRPDIVHVHHWIRLSRTLVQRARSAGIPCVVTLNDVYASCPRIFRVREGDPFCEDPLSVSACTNCVPREAWMSDEVVELKIRHFARDMSRELQCAHALIAPSKAHARVLAKFTNLPEDRFDLLAMGHDAGAPKTPSEPWTPDSGRPLRIAHWGNLVEYKGVHVLLEALRSLDSKDRVELILWGHAEDKAYGKKLRGLWRGLAIQRRRGFGPEDLESLEADVAVFPSLAHESHSFVLDEAFALGLPVLVSDRGALPERCGKGGAVFPAGDVAALARLIEGLLEDPEALARMRRELPRSLGFDEHWRRLEEIYSREHVEETAQNEKHVSEPRVFEELCVRLEDRSRELDGLATAAEAEVKQLRRDMAEQFSRLEERDKYIEHLKQWVENLQANLEGHQKEVTRLLEIENQLRVALGRIETLEAWVQEKNAWLAQKDEELAGRDRVIAGRDRVIADRDRVIADRDRQIEGLHGALEGEREALAEHRARLEELHRHVGHLERLLWKLGRENRLALPLVIPAKAALRAWDWLADRGRPVNREDRADDAEEETSD
ncbi:MAG: glycosyltransferase [Planctomycetota bacterium]